MAMGKGSLKTGQHTAKLEAKYSGAFFPDTMYIARARRASPTKTRKSQHSQECKNYTVFVPRDLDL